MWECTRTMITYQQFDTTSIFMYSKAYAYTDREEMNGLLFVSLPPSQQSSPVQVWHVKTGSGWTCHVQILHVFLSVFLLLQELGEANTLQDNKLLWLLFSPLYLLRLNNCSFVDETPPIDSPDCYTKPTYGKWCAYFCVFRLCCSVSWLWHVATEAECENPIIIRLNYSLFTTDPRH